MVVANHTPKNIKKNYVKLSLTPVISNMDKIYNRKTYMIRSVNYYLRISTIMLKRKLLGGDTEKDGNIESNFMALTDKDLDEENHLCILKDGTDSENAFKIVKLSPNEVKDILFARSTLPFITYFISYFSKKRYKMLKPSMYLKMEGILSKICCFIFGKSYRDGINIFNFDGEHIPERQRIMRELNLLDYLCELLSRPFSKGLFDIKILKENMPITRILAMTYTTIMYIIRENRPNELYCS